QPGYASAWPAPGSVTARTSPVDGSTTAMWPASVTAIRLPSGAHTGSDSWSVVVHRVRTPVPSALKVISRLLVPWRTAASMPLLAASAGAQNASNAAHSSPAAFHIAATLRASVGAACGLLRLDGAAGEDFGGRRRRIQPAGDDLVEQFLDRRIV